MQRAWIAIGFLIMAALACSFTNEEDSPTAIPTAAPVVFTNPTAAPTSLPTVTSAPTLAPTPSCSLRTDWPTVTVAAGETLFTIAQRVGSSVNELTQANCLTNANSLQAGQSLYVPVAVPPTVAAGSSSTGTGSSSGGSSGSGTCIT